MSETKPLYWSVQRELWENRSIYIAPIVAGAFVLFGYVISTIGMPHRRRALMLKDAAHQQAAIVMPYDAAAVMLFFVAFLVAVFYCLDALHGERRDRSILFWKSLPVSDRTTIASKAIVPMAIVPAVAFVTAVVTQMLMLMWTTIVLAPSGLSGTTFIHYHPMRQAFILLYGFVACTLWSAPIYAWLLLVSVWARRATLLWPVLPWLLVAALEKIAFGTTYFGNMLRYRLVGFAQEAFVFTQHGNVHLLSQLTPLRYLSTAGLWVGLIFAAICLALAARLRRNREPL